MNSIRVNIFIILLAFGTTLNGQIERGSLLLNELPEAFNKLVFNDSINLKELRVMTDVLTNDFLTELNGVPYDKRKKAFKRHIQNLSEILELTHFKKSRLKVEEYEHLFELLIFYKAYLLSSEMNAQNIRYQDKVAMMWNTVRSKRNFKYNSKRKIFYQEPGNSPYWHKVDSIPLHKRFGQLADLKKIKRKDQMVVLFNGISESGSAPKIKTSDLDFDNEWMLKWGDEIHTDILGSRIFAALGFDVDHPYFYGKDDLILVFDKSGIITSKDDLVKGLIGQYDFDLEPFISKFGRVDLEMVEKNDDLENYIGKQFCTFKKCAIEARPDRVKRIGPFMIRNLLLDKRIVVRGALLANAFIDNWDTRSRNTLITTVHYGDHTYRISAVYSDLGTSFGVKLSPVKGDFKVGLVNEYAWDLAEEKRNKIFLNYQMNEISEPYRQATFEDLYWMATKIADLDSITLRRIIAKAGWPSPISELYFHKLSSRRASILEAFRIPDIHPISFNRELTIAENGVLIIEKGVLLIDYDRINNPESFLNGEGRFRNYGN